MKWTAVGLLVAALSAQDEELKPVDAEFARGIAERLIQETGSFEKPVFTIDADPAKAVGLHIPDKMGLLVVPQKDVKEGESDEHRDAKGKRLGYLFFYRMVPAPEGKALDASKLHAVKISNDEGKSFTIPVLLLSVRRVNDDWRLYGFGKDEKPVIDVKLSGGNGPGETPVGIQMKEVAGRKDTLVVTLFDKYQAAVPVARLKD